jgi:hypothetical protein
MRPRIVFSLLAIPRLPLRMELKEAVALTVLLNLVVLEPATAATLAQFRQLDAEVVGGPDGRPVGHLHAEFHEGEFSYQFEWTGPQADVQELGWTFQLPSSCDYFSWDRAALWTVYPPNNIGRSHGTATPDTMDVPYTRMDRPDAFDFNSTKYNCNWASLTTAQGVGLRVEFDPAHRFECRAGRIRDGEGYELFVNQQVSPADDFITAVVRDFYLKLKKGDTIQGRFRVGSNLTVPESGSH